MPDCSLVQEIKEKKELRVIHRLLACGTGDLLFPILPTGTFGS